MKTLLIVIFNLFVGISIGWYFGYTRPINYYERNFKKITGMSDQQVAEAYRDTKSALKSIGSEERAVAIMSFGVIKSLDAGHSAEEIKAVLGQQVAAYYHTFQKFENPSPDRDDFLKSIESSTSPTIKAALVKKPE